MCKLDKKNGLWRIDPCMKVFVAVLDEMLDKDIRVVACCCGHGKYPMTIICKGLKGSEDRAFDLCSDNWIPRKKRFYVKDKQGYYFIPEAINF